MHITKPQQLKTKNMSPEEYPFAQILIDEIKDNLDVYDHIIEEELYKEEQLPTEIENQINQYNIDYETPAEALTELAKQTARQRYLLKERISYDLAQHPPDIHTEYQEIEDKLWSIPVTLSELEGVELPETSLGRIITGHEEPDD